MCAREGSAGSGFHEDQLEYPCCFLLLKHFRRISSALFDKSYALVLEGPGMPNLMNGVIGLATVIQTVLSCRKVLGPSQLEFLRTFIPAHKQVLFKGWSLSRMKDN